MNTTSVFLIVTGTLLLWLPAYADTPPDAGVDRTVVTIEDNWPAQMFTEGTISCPGGELDTTNPLFPICAASGRIHIRDVVVYSCATSDDDARVSGVARYTINGNLDANYTGPVWGKWMVVPWDSCDLLKLIEPDEFWEGSWQGERSFESDAVVPYWLGDLKVVGKGYGGEIDGLHFKGTELIKTYTGIPVPYEILPPIPGVDPNEPEGILTTTIKE